MATACMPAVSYTHLDVYKRQVLKNYGVQVQELGGVLRFFPTPTAGYGMPQVIAARSRAEVPPSQRPVFVAMPLEAAVPGQITGIMRSVFGTCLLYTSRCV